MKWFLFCLFALFLILPFSTFGSTLPVSESNFRFAIDQVQSSLGAEVELSVRNINESPKPGVGKGNAIGSFSFLFNYDDLQLEYVGVRLGRVLEEQKWEIALGQIYDSCKVGGDCYSYGPILIKAIAESKYVDGHAALTRQSTGEWLVLKFKVKEDCRLSGQVLPVSWYWENCNDNTLTNFPENRIWVVDSLIRMDGQPVDLKTALPRDISKCDTVPLVDNKVRVEKGITFVNGGIKPHNGECQTTPQFTSCPGPNPRVLYGRTFTFDFQSDREGEPGVKYSLETFTGRGNIDSLSGIFILEPACQSTRDVFFARVTDETGRYSLCKFSVATYDNPPISKPESSIVTVPNGQLATNKIMASDPDSEDVLSYYVISGPGQIDSNGLWTYQTSCKDASNSPQTVYVEVTDGFRNCRQGPLNTFTSFQVDVSNYAPNIICPPNTQVVMGKPYQVQVTAQDPDPADSGNLTFALVSGPAGLSVSPSGLVQWTPSAADLGRHLVHLKTLDLCGASSDCVYEITVVEGTKFRIAIDTVTGEQGADVEVAIRNLDDAADPTLANGKSVGGFSFLLAYDCGCLQFLSARKGELLVNQGWEFFTYRFGAVGNGNCGAGCPACLIRITAVTDVNNGDLHPNLTRENRGEWVVLKFRTTSDRTLVGQFCQINWFWFDCADNALSDSTGQRLWVVDSLYSHSGSPINIATAFPSNVSTCTTFVAGKPQPKKYAIFVNGGIQLPVPTEIDERGDLDLNGISNELADFVLLRNYIAGNEAVLFRDSILRQQQIKNSDVNGDGFPLGLSDLVTMARIITGDANPLPTGQLQAVHFTFIKEDQNLVVSTTSNFELGGIFLRLNFSRTVGLPIKLDSAVNMEFAGSGDSSQWRMLLVASQKDARIPAGTHRVLLIPYTGTLEPFETAAATYYGIALPTFVSIPTDVEEDSRQIPKNISLSQNFPNPFNPSTSFTLSMPKAGRYSVRIYNLAGQAVKTFEGEAPAGTHTLSWNGTDQNGVSVSSGIYLYKAETKGYSQTKKMILIR